MSHWCPWYSPTGKMVRHKISGVVGEVVWHHTSGHGDVEVRLPSGGLVTWFGKNIEPVPQPRTDLKGGNGE